MTRTGDADIRILIIDENLVRTSILEDGLREAGIAGFDIATPLARPCVLRCTSSRHAMLTA